MAWRRYAEYAPHDVPGIIRPYRGMFVVAMIVGSVSAACGLAQPLAIGNVVSTIGQNGSMAVPISILAALFLASAGLGVLQAHVIGRLGEGIVLDLRQMLVSRLLRALVLEHRKRRSGDIFARVITDTSVLKAAMSQSLATVSVSSLTVVGCLAVMFAIDPLLAGLTVGCLVLGGAGTALVGRRLRRAAEVHRAAIGSLGTDLQRAIGGVDTIKLSRAERTEEKRITRVARSAYQSGMNVTKLTAMMSPLTGTSLQLAFAVVFIAGTIRVRDGALDLATLIALVLYLFQLIGPLVALATALGELQQARAASGRIHELLGLPIEDGDRSPSLSRSPSRATTGSIIEVEDVSFRYAAGGPEVLRRASFSIPARGLTAIVGASGAGKSTLFQLVTRFYVPQSGRITLAGVDVEDVPLETLRARVGYVQQSPALMDGTVRENICYAKYGASDAEIAAVVRLANLQGVIGRLAHGLDTNVGEQGGTLSGGEQQRIAIARMLLLAPDVLLLDEVTSALDPMSEVAIRETLRKVADRCAAVTVAHRMSTVMDADRIIVLDQGRVRAVGTHQSLLASDEYYQTMVQSQFISPADAAAPQPVPQAVDGAPQHSTYPVRKEDGSWDSYDQEHEPVGTSAPVRPRRWAV